MLHVAIVGTGGISPAHIESYLMFPERCRIVALVDIMPEKAMQKKEQYGLECDVFSDHHEILTRDDIDLVDVCTPPYTHAEISINALNASKNVLCEKPMAASLEECDAMIQARDRSGKMLSVIAQNRFRKPIRDLKAILDSGIAGKVRHAEIDSFWFRGHSYYDMWWRGLWEKEGGGCTLNHAVHHIDMLGWMMGLPEKVTSVIANVGHDNAEVEDLSVSILKYRNALATLQASVIHHGEEQKLVFQCEKAKIAAPYDCFCSQPQSNGFPLKDSDHEFEVRVNDFLQTLPELKYEAHPGQIESYIRSIETDGDIAITAEDGRRTIELITAIYESGSMGRTVELPIEKTDPFYTVNGIRENVPYFYKKNKSVSGFEGEITFGSDFKGGI